MTFSRLLLAAAPIAALLVSASGQATTVTAPNAYADTPGYEYQSGVFGNGSTNSATFQEGFAGSELTAITSGSYITGIGYRLASNLPTIADDVTFADFTVQIGTASVPIANLSLSFAGNQGADTITARSGALTIPGGSLANNGGLNPFYTISFATPYLYQGGDLLLTTSYSVTGTVPFIGVDAIDPFGTVNTLAGNDPAFLRTHVFNAPIVQFTSAAAAAVPEPASWTMLIAGFGLTGAALRSGGRRRPSAI